MSAPGTITAATWNLKQNTAHEDKAAYLQTARWDVACLQEVAPRTATLLKEREGVSVIYGLDLAPEELEKWRFPHGAAIVARSGWSLDSPRLIPETRAAGRGISAVARREGQALSIASWHAPHAVPDRRRGESKGEVVARKMRAYRGLVAHLAGFDKPVVLGMDGNHWNLRTKLELPMPPEEGDPFYEELLFFGANPHHRLRDALLVYLAERPEEHRELLKARPEGPLYVTHRRGGSGRPDRFDYLMVSNDVEVSGITTDLEGAAAAGSDHAFCTADLETEW